MAVCAKPGASGADTNDMLHHLCCTMVSPAVVEVQFVARPDRPRCNEHGPISLAQRTAISVDQSA